MAHGIKWPLYLPKTRVSFRGSRINEYENRKRKNKKKKSVTNYSWLFIRAFHGEKNREQNEIKKMLKRYRVARRFNIATYITDLNNIVVK